MAPAPIVALTIGALLALENAMALAVAAPFIVLWVASPQIAYAISLPLDRGAHPLSTAQNLELRRLARRTWLFYEDFAGPDDNWLPPDHYQESPRGLVAHRTSPTNIGMLLLSTLSAYDLGYLGLIDLVLRLRHHGDAGPHGALSRPPVELVRHAEPRSAAGALRCPRWIAATWSPA